MTKYDFLELLEEKLSGLPEKELAERLTFYGEMIDDRMEEGLSEEEAVAAIGNVEDIVSQVLEDTPITKLVKEKIKPKRKRKVWETVLLILGFPIWFSLLVAAFAVVFALYVSLWSVIISLWACDVAFAGCSVGGVISGAALMGTGNVPAGLAMIGCGVVCAGLFVFFLYGCKAATRGVVLLTKKIVLALKRCFLKMEVA